MKCKDVKYYLSEYLNGKLIDEMRKEIGLHIKNCHSCNKKSVQLISSLKSTGKIRQKIHQGKDFWEGVSDLNENYSELKLPDILFSPIKRRDDPPYKLRIRKNFLRSKWIAIGAPLASILLAILLSVLYVNKSSPSFWQVESIKGKPTVGNEEIVGLGVLRLGEWLKTDASSEAILKAGLIGEIDIKPGSEIQLFETNDKEYKLYLSVGKIVAKIFSPPNMFIVKTPSAEAIDLGCDYTIEVNKDGSSVLQVTSGWVVFKSGKNESILPAGTACETRIINGSGTPYNYNTSEKFKAALTRFDFYNDREFVLEEILNDAGKQDAISLWYLLKKTNAEEKKMIYNQLVELVPPPANITFEGIMKDDNAMLLNWGEKIGCGSKALWDSVQKQQTRLQGFM